MKQTFIQQNKTGYFSSIMQNYTEGKLSNDFWMHEMSLNGLLDSIENRHTQNHNRGLLSENLIEQNSGIVLTDASSQNIESLKDSSTVTVTTGHQLNIFTGPLFFIYKIITAINIAEEVSKNTAVKCVPIYWMATEDHDFEEIQSLNIYNEKITWENDQKGAVGEFDLKGFDDIILKLEEVLKTSLPNFIKEAYAKDNLSEATRYLVNHLFGEYGLVIIDANNRTLKQEFAPLMAEELTSQFSFKNVGAQSQKLKEQHKIQVNPREINLFYLRKQERTRITLSDGVYETTNGKYQWSKASILDELENTPERFSPNVILRPLYQELILPNIAYVGGGGELAYWLQLKSMFHTAQVPFPVLWLRNSLLLVNQNQQKKWLKTGLTAEQLFLNEEELVKLIVSENEEIKITEPRELILKAFSVLKSTLISIDKSLEGATEAELSKQLKGIEQLKKRGEKAAKRKHEDAINRVVQLRNSLFPNNGLQERHDNVMPIYLQNEESIIATLKEVIDPFQIDFQILELD